MISIGGIDPTISVVHDAWGHQDPNAHGLAVFDMVELAWKDSYDANAKPYTMPSAIADWYSAS